MKLQYFELDKPYVENQQRIEELMDSAALTYEEARIKDYRQNWKDLRRAFVYESKCMTSMVERLFKPVVTKDCWKIIVECVDTISNPAIMNLLGVYTVQVLFDFSSYETLSPLEQKKLLLKVDLFWKIEHKDKSIRQLIQSCPAHEMDYGAKLGKLETKGNFLYLLNKDTEVVSRISVLE